MPLGTVPKMTVPAELVPRCPKCGAPMTMNLRCDAAFVEDDGWHAAAARYQGFVEQHRKSAILYLELGVGLNTPGIIKYNFWQQAYENPNAVYACVNQGKDFFRGVNVRYHQYAVELSGKLGLPAAYVQGMIYIFVRACVHYALFEDEEYLQLQLNAIRASLTAYLAQGSREKEVEKHGENRAL